MTLITVLLGLFLEHFVGYLDEFRKLGWFRAYSRWMTRSLGSLGEEALGVLLIVLPPVLGLWVVIALVDDVMLGLLEIVLGVVVLLYCLGPKDLEAQVDAFVEANAMGDAERLKRATGELIGGEVPEDNQACARAVTEAVFVESHRRIFAVLFWFMVLGPIGAALYRMSSLLAAGETERESVRGASQRLTALLEWAPARLTALALALTGRFEDCLPVLRRYLLGGWQTLGADNEALLREVGAEALDLEEGLSEELDATGISILLETAMNLLTRALVLWVTVLALLTIGGWAS